MPLEMLPDDTERWQKEEGLTNAGSHCLRKKNLDCVRTFYASAVPNDSPDNTGAAASEKS
jgi:hypothetical protein